MTATTERMTVLRAFRRALRRESHVLSRWPGITSQQLHNRLRWENPLIASVADVARAGLDSDGHVTLVYETPEVDAGLLGRVRDQFGGLLEGVIGLEQGR